MDAADLARFQAALRSRAGLPAYQWYFDFDGDRDVDTADYYEFLRRLQTR